jgi:hypothetical protein
MKLKEQDYPVAENGKPDLSRYSDPVEHYLELYERYLGTIGGRSGSGYEQELAFARRVHATWGLIAKGAAAVPHALLMLRHAERDAREDGAAILAELGARAEIVDGLLDALEAETSSEPRDSIIAALGQMRSQRAIPALAAIVRAESTDGDTRWTAVEALGRIARKRFLKQVDPISAAKAWLEKRGI